MRYNKTSINDVGTAVKILHQIWINESIFESNLNYDVYKYLSMSMSMKKTFLKYQAALKNSTEHKMIKIDVLVP